MTKEEEKEAVKIAAEQHHLADIHHKSNKGSAQGGYQKRIKLFLKTQYKNNKGPWLSPRSFVVVGRKERIGVEKYQVKWP